MEEKELLDEEFEVLADQVAKHDTSKQTEAERLADYMTLRRWWQTKGKRIDDDTATYKGMPFDPERSYTWEELTADLKSRLNEKSPHWLVHDIDKLGKLSVWVPDINLFVDDIKERRHIIVVNDTHPDGLYWNGKYWDKFTKQQPLLKVIKSDSIKLLNKYRVFDKVSRQKRSDMIELAQTLIPEPSYQVFESEDLVSFENGTLDLKTMQLHEYSEDDYLTSLLPVEIIASEDGGLLAEYARYLLGDDDQTLIEWFGYMFFLNDDSLQHIVFIQGQGGNGKSTLLKVLLKAFGFERFGGSISFSQLAGKDSSRYMEQLAGMYANILTESDSTISTDGLDILKKIASGDPLTANPKGRDTYSFKVHAKFLISANFNLPTFPDQKEYSRRLVLLSAGAKPITDMDDAEREAYISKYHEDKLVAELPKFIYYAITQAKKAIARRRLTITDAAKQRTADWLTSDDLLSQFMKEYFVDTQGTNGVTVKYAHDMFKAFLMSEGIPANKVIGVSEFRKSLVSHNITYTKTAAPANKADAELVDDYAKPSRNRIKGKGIKTNDQQVMTKPDDIYKHWELLK
ncbi:DNA primase family protein [Weissella confusa]|uniref:DNA primase family protein n=1 Tax=Weissella confusa TaxID=1583 RepID=UPI00223BC26E|nr:DUF5906 domain-containing protein [Weissella confusa]MCT0006367.1 hypothetical protein [Weissella confusa]MCT0017883.1 hypothetical protein [Weissella confusa]